MFVVGFSVGVAGLIAAINHSFLKVYDSAGGQVILLAIAGLYAVGFLWLTRLARFDMPQRILRSRQPGGLPAEIPETVSTWQGGAP